MWYVDGRSDMGECSGIIEEGGPNRLLKDGSCSCGRDWEDSGRPCAPSATLPCSGSETAGFLS